MSVTSVCVCMHKYSQGYTQLKGGCMGDSAQEDKYIYKDEVSGASAVFQKSEKKTFRDCYGAR